MGKNLRSKFQVFDSLHDKTLDVDSREEVEFTKWLCKANFLGIIQDFVYQPDSFKLADKVEYLNSKGKPRTLLREHVYTADFLVFLDPKKFPFLAEEFRLDCGAKSKKDLKAYYIDVKGGFQKDAGRAFSMNQKWLYERFHVYVHKVVPKVFFKKFGIVEDFRFTEKTHKPSKKYADCPTIEEVFVENKG